MSAASWSSDTIIVRGLSGEAAQILTQRVARFQQARRQACLSLLQRRSGWTGGDLRPFVPHPAMQDEARRWAAYLIEPQTGLLTWYRDLIDRLPSASLWDLERDFYRTLYPQPLPDLPRGPARLWRWHHRDGLDLSPWLGHFSLDVELVIHEQLGHDFRLGIQPVLGHWVHWQGEWLIHVIWSATRPASRAASRVAAALLVPSLAGPGGGYQVREGDTLWGIARQQLGHGREWGRIHALNRDQVPDPHWIYPGQQLAMPDRTSQQGAGESAQSRSTPQGTGVSASAPKVVGQGDGWVVRAGDTLWRIAEAKTGQGNRWPELLEANRDRLQRPQGLPVGLQLRWPEKWVVPATAVGEIVSAQSTRRDKGQRLTTTLQQRPVGKAPRTGETGIAPVRPLLPTGTAGKTAETPAPDETRPPSALQRATPLNWPVVPPTAMPVSSSPAHSPIDADQGAVSTAKPVLSHDPATLVGTKPSGQARPSGTAVTTLADDPWVFAIDDQPSANDSRMVAADDQPSANDSRVVTADDQPSANDSRVVAADDQPSANNSRVVATDDKSLANESRVATGDAKGLGGGGGPAATGHAHHAVGDPQTAAGDSKTAASNPPVATDGTKGTVGDAPAAVGIFQGATGDLKVAERETAVADDPMLADSGPGEPFIDDMEGEAPAADLPIPHVAERPSRPVEPILPASGGTDPWEHWLQGDQRAESRLEHKATAVLPMVGPRGLWPTIGYQAVPEYLSESSLSKEDLRGWVANRQRLSADWTWDNWQLRGRWTFGRYELPLADQLISRQESWVDLDVGQQWRPMHQLQLGLAARGTWWQRRAAGPESAGLRAADLQGFGIGPVGSVAWTLLDGHALVMETAVQPLIPVSFSGAAQASGQVGQVEGFLGWQGQWGMWRPLVGYRGRWLYDADGTFNQLGHGLVAGLSAGWAGTSAEGAGR